MQGYQTWGYEISTLQWRFESSWEYEESNASSWIAYWSFQTICPKKREDKHHRKTYFFTSFRSATWTVFERSQLLKEYIWANFGLIRNKYETIFYHLTAIWSNIYESKNIYQLGVTLRINCCCIQLKIICFKDFYQIVRKITPKMRIIRFCSINFIHLGRLCLDFHGSWQNQQKIFARRTKLIAHFFLFFFSILLTPSHMVA